jgi:hypothetical protein
MLGTQMPAQPPPKGRHAPTQHLPAPQQSDGVSAALRSGEVAPQRATGDDWDGSLIFMFLSWRTGPGRAVFVEPALSEPA